MTCKAVDHGAIVAPQPGQLRVFTARNLTFLRAIEEAVSALAQDCEILGGIERLYEEIEKAVRNAPSESPLDESGELSRSLAESSAACERLHQRAMKAIQSARAEPHLTEEDGVESAWEKYRSLVVAIHELVEEIRERIETHDALLSPVSEKIHPDADSLFRALGIG